MTGALDWTALTVFALLFGLVTILGFVAARWRQGDLSDLHEWGLGGRRFGTIVTWFLLGGDLYTAYTFVAVPALMFGAGAIGFFAVPYTILVYPVLFAVFPRLWSVSHRHGYVTSADFVRGRFGNHALALAVAVTGIVATMPYIALQLVGIEVVIAGLGIHGELPLIIAFVILAAYTYTSGLRAPAMIAVVKDLLIYITIITAVIYIPLQLGGFAKIFAAVPAAKLTIAAGNATNWGGQSAYVTLALGSALALFLYPHAVTGVLSSSSRHVIRRNAVVLPAYSLALGLIALLGYMALAAGVKDMPAYADGFKEFGANYAVPALFLAMFPNWFVGLAFAAIAIGALVPAAIMSIACANLFTRNIWKEYINPKVSGAGESQIAKIASLVVKVGALFFIIFMPQQYAINLQLLGGIWIIQTLPAVLIGLYTRWLNPWALLIGWAAGIGTGTAMAYAVGFKAIYALHLFGITIPCYAALATLIFNIAVSVILSAVFNLAGRGADATQAADYL
ncbi:MAG: sodium:solute symporter [Alphaproteobacteria bacterium]|nr:sodium:solute symporter [Alphaproteobacteria bacterium]MBU6472229.1 sodium:solute symporter [Alphaproteobacteria bacterium]MDE2072258.1 sodium:solute symporter [Alphaproteobacteria bacterium]